MPKYRNILHPTDLSRSSRTAARHALDLAKMYGTRLFVLHVLDDLFLGSDFLMEQIDLQSILRRVKARVQKEMEAMVSKRSWQGVKVETAVREGDPADEILRFAQERKAGLIVMGAHAVSGLEHMFLGRSARRVVRNSPIPVLTVRGEDAPARKRR